MDNEKIQCLVVGSGKVGADWALRQPNKSAIVCVDTQNQSGCGLFVNANTFDLPFKNGSILKVHADFIVNGLIDRDPGADKILKNPDILDSSDFPPLVRHWFTDSLKRSHDQVRKNITDVGWLLKKTALREMWRVIAPAGGVEVLDFGYNTNWILHFAPDILDIHPELVRLSVLPMTENDWERSGSLKKVQRGKTKVQKIKICKLPPYQSQFTI